MTLPEQMTLPVCVEDPHWLNISQNIYGDFTCCVEDIIIYKKS